jgi:shikimate dehydrogenase
MNITAKTKICMVIGDPIIHSLSPQMHNSGYKALGIDNEYVYVGCNIKLSDIPNFINGVRAMNIRGVSCTIPHKIEIMKYLDKVDTTAKKIGAVNTVVNENGILKGTNTDWIGVVKPLEKLTTLKGKTVALLGAGGAARAVAYGVTKRGAKLLIFNRTVEKAQTLAKEFGGKIYRLDELKNITQADIIINTTSVGLAPKVNETPLPKKFITSKHIVFDAVYVPFETRLLKDAKENGAQIIHGTEMLLYQGMAQFKLFTGYKAPEEEIRKVLLENI